MGEKDVSTELTQGAQEALGTPRAMGGWGRALTKPGLRECSLEEVTSELKWEGSGGVNQMQGQQALEW